MTHVIQPTTVQWLDRPALVFTILRRMITDGWAPSDEHRGVVHGNYVVRPVRKPGEAGYTGLALFNLKETEDE